jgi:hypothetical protein
LQDKGDYVLPSGLTVSQCHKEIIARANLNPSRDDEGNLIPQYLSRDDEGNFVPREDRVGLSEKMKELKKMYEMIEELEVAAETVRIEDAVCKNQVRYRCHACSFSIKPSLLKNAWVLFIHHTELTVLPFL